jgi:hypothetical protein
VTQDWPVATAERIERCWAWLEHWGHSVNRVAVEDLDLDELLALGEAEAQRVVVLADAWDTWW